MRPRAENKDHDCNHRHYFHVQCQEVVLRKLGEDNHREVHGLDVEYNRDGLVDDDGLVELKSNVHLSLLDILIKNDFYLQDAIGVLNSWQGNAGIAGEGDGRLEVHFVKVGDGRDDTDNEVACVFLFVAV